MERGLMMLLHSAIIGLLMYGLMVFMGVGAAIAENRAMLVLGASLIYMVVFGHGLPTRVRGYF